MLPGVVALKGELIAAALGPIRPVQATAGLRRRLRRQHHAAHRIRVQYGDRTLPLPGPKGSEGAGSESALSLPYQDVSH